MPRWIWWVLGGIAVLMIWKGQGATLGQDVGRVIRGTLAALSNI